KRIIMKVNFSHSKSKINTLIDAISNDIASGVLKLGDNLPSINETSLKFKISRDTVFKAYKELKRRNLIDSNPMKGYFVKGEVNHVLLLLDTYSPFKQNLYNRFAQNLPKSWKVDLIFHQYNKNLFDTIIRESIGRYSMYVVMNFSNTEFSESLKSIPEGKLLLLDFGDFDKKQYPYLCQNFDQALYDCLSEHKPIISKYKKIVMIFPTENNHPKSSIKFVKEFCSDSNIAFELIEDIYLLNNIEENVLYFIMSHTDLVSIILASKNKNLKIGQDIGILVYNDEPLLEVIQEGIAAISIDFGLLGEKAAQFIKDKMFVQEFLPTRFIFRPSI
ncbi:MAG TPA: GntR family transcriptional regulator, partial [Paludibacteraceae bacterium]|nr:GntR family transcriptional regulator [Paludibacteraceae bacterium]HOR39840.1 GntR family transcriptional regulator [Paludibacteraceae bacterium]